MIQQMLDEISKYAKMLVDPSLQFYCSEVLLDAVGSFGKQDQTCWVHSCAQIMILCKARFFLLMETLVRSHEL